MPTERGEHIDLTRDALHERVRGGATLSAVETALLMNGQEMSDGATFAVIGGKVPSIKLNMQSREEDEGRLDA